jgi:hypothetical protein
VAPSARNPPSPIENAATPLAARTTEPKAPAAEVRPLLLDEVHGRYDNLTVPAVTFDLQLMAGRERWLVATQRCEIDPAQGLRDLATAYTPNS